MHPLLSAILSSLLMLTCAGPVRAQNVTNEYFEEPLFDQPVSGLANEHLYIGRHAEANPYYQVKTGDELEALPKDVMNLMLWADNTSTSLQAASEVSHLSPWTGVQPPSPYSPYQYSTNAASAGSSGFQTNGAEVGINIHSPTFPMYNDFGKGTQVLQYDFSQPPLPFQRSLRDELEFSFDLMVRSAEAHGGASPETRGAVNVYGYLLLKDDASKNICVGVGAFDLRSTEGQALSVFGDPETGCLIVSLPMGRTPEFNLSNSTTAVFSNTPGPDYRSYKLRLNGLVFRDLLKRVNDHLIDAGMPLISYDPSVYRLHTALFNPEIYMPVGAYAQIGMGVKNLRVMSRLTYPTVGYVDAVQQEAGGWFVSGWACAKSWESPITVALFAGQSYEGGGTHLASATTNLPNTGAESAICSTAADVPHRFKIQVPPSALSATTAVPLYVHARRELPNEPSVLLPKSGSYLIGNGTVVQPPLIDIYRWVRGKDRTYGTDPHEYEATGYVNEGVVFRLKTLPSPGAVPLYRCVVPGRVDHFMWNSVDCNGNANEGFLGYAEANAIQGMSPIHLFYHSAHQVHLATTSLAEGWSNGYTLQYVPAAQLGYAW